ncbi:MAG TPA: SUF system Fe-S cluster assembly protein [Chitinophagales bacterium]|nr:SUF system Fe-S cluster assembly protein [Chitinophagales bacterium]HMV01935.1 SUF system Fe-S cluster assembly protein [Chitinophagales bacterium]HMW93873.1 SUF system Fe-S cluster assembly protein [Chitinophagales bacterium]HMY42081.1 SUF system Fe-S cluster assembly protein [Chitinophagales bacterium]HMZ67824.1 SUF system Fe-S cluster assembly protein [Chitinophagales bacterium]
MIVEKMNKTFIEVKNDVIELLHEIYDPEIPVNIFDLGLVYEAEVDMENNVHIVMTLTSPNCPVAESLPKEVEDKIKEIDGVNNVKVEVTFEPPWDQDMMTEEAKLELGFL